MLFWSGSWRHRVWVLPWDDVSGWFPLRSNWFFPTLYSILASLWSSFFPLKNKLVERIFNFNVKIIFKLEDMLKIFFDYWVLNSYFRVCVDPDIYVGIKFVLSNLLIRYFFHFQVTVLEIPSWKLPTGAAPHQE